jgi:hypothetical protein
MDENTNKPFGMNEKSSESKIFLIQKNLTDKLILGDEHILTTDKVESKHEDSDGEPILNQRTNLGDDKM